MQGAPQPNANDTGTVDVRPAKTGPRETPVLLAMTVFG